MELNKQGTATLQRPASRVEITNAFLRSVYNWMAIGLGLTAAVSFALTYTSLKSLLFVGMGNTVMFTSMGQTIFLVSAIGQIALVFFLSFRVDRLSGGTATTLFMVYSVLMGAFLSFVLIRYSVGSVAQAFIASTGMFAAMSVYGLVTKRDLAGMGSFLFMGLIGLLIAMVVNFFMQSSMMTFIISLVGVGLFLGLTAYDTQLLKEMGESVPRDNEVAVRRATIMGALRLYLDFINLFLFMLRLFGDRR